MAAARKALSRRPMRVAARLTLILRRAAGPTALTLVAPVGGEARGTDHGKDRAGDILSGRTIGVPKSYLTPRPDPTPSPSPSPGPSAATSAPASPAPAF